MIDTKRLRELRAQYWGLAADKSHDARGLSLDEGVELRSLILEACEELEPRVQLNPRDATETALQMLGRYTEDPVGRTRWTSEEFWRRTVSAVTSELAERDARIEELTQQLGRECENWALVVQQRDAALAKFRGLREAVEEFHATFHDTPHVDKLGPVLDRFSEGKE